MKITVNNGQYKITIPKDRAMAKGWTKKTRLRFVEAPDGTVMLKEIKQGND